MVGITKHSIVGTKAGASETDKSDMLTERQQRASDDAGKSRDTVHSTCRPTVALLFLAICVEQRR